MTNLAELAVEVKQDWESKCSPEEVKELLGSLTPMEQGGRSEIIEMAYPRLDLGFLRQRRANGFPKFAVFCLDSPWCMFVAGFIQSRRYKMLFGVHQEGEIEWHDNYGESLSTFLNFNYFSNVREYLGDNSIRQEFNGILPNRVREDIKKANEVWDGPIVIIADAGEWTIFENEQVGKSKVDPLVVKLVRHGGHYSSAFLISAFDVSSAEELVAREFSTGKVSEILERE